MSNERDELIRMIWDDAVADRVRDGKDLRNVPVVRPKVEAMADAILAAGYRRPRTITTVEELEALANGTIITDRTAYAWQRIAGQWVSWLNPGEGSEWLVSGLRGPFTVLHEAVAA